MVKYSSSLHMMDVAEFEIVIIHYIPNSKSVVIFTENTDINVFFVPVRKLWTFRMLAWCPWAQWQQLLLLLR